MLTQRYLIRVQFIALPAGDSLELAPAVLFLVTKLAMMILVDIHSFYHSFFHSFIHPSIHSFIHSHPYKLLLLLPSASPSNPPPRFQTRAILCRFVSKLYDAYLSIYLSISLTHSHPSHVLTASINLTRPTLTLPSFNGRKTVP